MSHKSPDWTMLCPLCFGSGEVTFEDERYGKGFGRFQSHVRCGCQPVREPVEYAVREVRQRLEALLPEAEAFLESSGLAQKIARDDWRARK